MRIPFITARRDRAAMAERQTDEAIHRMGQMVEAVHAHSANTRRVGEALYALGDHSRPADTVRSVPHGAIETLADKTRDGQQEIANAIRSLAAALRENAAVLRTGGRDRDRSEHAIARLVDRQRDAAIFQVVSLRRPAGSTLKDDFVMDDAGPVAIFPDQVVDVSPHRNSNGRACVITTTSLHEGNSGEWYVAGSLVEVIAGLKAVAR